MRLTQHDREPEMGTHRNSDRLGLDPVALGLALGTAMAASVGTISVAARLGWGDGWRVLLADIYPGYERDEGTVLGVVWGAVDGFVGGLLIGWLYNTFLDAQG